MDLSEITPEKVLDMRGLTYPLPVLKTKKAIMAMIDGNILEVWCADPDSKKDLEQLGPLCSCTCLGAIDDPAGFTRFFIQKHTALHSCTPNKGCIK